MDKNVRLHKWFFFVVPLGGDTVEIMPLTAAVPLSLILLMIATKGQGKLLQELFAS